MNGMNYKPFITKVLNSLSDEETNKFNQLLQSHSNDFKNRSLINASNLLSVSDKNSATDGVGLYTIQLDNETIRTGYLVYNSTVCVLLAYQSNSEKITEYEINPTNMTYKVAKEFLTTDYLRHEVAIRATKYEGNDDANIYEVTDIKTISKAILDELKCGDIVQKKTDNQKHAYVVTYKEEEHGICLSYFDGSGYIETVSYDYTDGHWVYNSTDVFKGNEILPSTETASAGQILGLNIDKSPEWKDKINLNEIKGNSIVENMGTAYYFEKLSETSGVERTFNYVGIVKNGNKLTLVVSGTLKRTDATANLFNVGDFHIPTDIGAKLFPYELTPFGNVVASVGGQCWKDFNVSNRKEISILFRKYSNNYIDVIGYSSPLELDTLYAFRVEQTFLLSDNLVPSGE